jgi:GH35 family endo-1,4-beta-xylanase
LRRNNSFYFCLMFLKIAFVSLIILSCKSFSQPLAEGQSKFLGCCLGSTTGFDSYWNQVTPENAGKWESVEGGQKNSYNWTGLDNAYNYAQTHGFLYRHHNLVWGQQQPGWLSSLDSIEKITEVEEWIRLVGERYPDMDYIDVVNEPLHLNPAPTYKDALGGNGATGWDWVIKVFELARQYCDSSVELHINDYSIINSNSATNQYLVIINLLKERGLIDGIGVQGHYFELGSSNAATLKTNLDKLAETGLPIYITEFDVNEANDYTQLQKYHILFPALWEHPAVGGITFWGYRQYAIWQQNAYLVRSNGSERPALKWIRAYLAGQSFVALPSASITFDEWPVGYTKSSAYTIQNFGVDTLEISSITSSDDQFTVKTSAMTILPGASFRDTVYFSPANEGVITAQLTINSNSPNSPDVVTLQGTGIPATQLAGKQQILNDYRLYQNYPNPFNAMTTINYSLASENLVEIKLFDVNGRELKTLINQKLPAGKYAIELDAAELNSGVYFYQIQAGSFSQSRKMILLK